MGTEPHMQVTHEDLFEAGVHLGHQMRRWNPKSKPYVYGQMQGVSIVDLEKTHKLLGKAYAFIQGLVGNGGTVLMVGTKEQARDIVREAAVSVGMPYCTTRWLGGTLTNFSTIRCSLEKYRKFLDMQAKGEIEKMHSKEAAALGREMTRMGKNFEGILHVNTLPQAMFVVDIHSEAIAVAEARKLKIPVIALVDTNSDPTLVDYPIPGNDDAVKAIRLIVETIAEAVQNGLQYRESHKGSKNVKPFGHKKDKDDLASEGIVLAANIQEAMAKAEEEGVK